MANNTPAIQQLMDDIRQRANQLGLTPDIERTRRRPKKPVPTIGRKVAAGDFLSISAEERNWDIMCPLEDDEQEALFQWFDNHPDRRLLKAFAIPNGTYKSRKAAVKHLHTGLKSGIPDIMVPIAAGGYHGLFVEMKRRKSGQLSSNQKERIAGLQEEGYKVIVSRGWHDATRQITEYLEAKGCEKETED